MAKEKKAAKVAQYTSADIETQRFPDSIRKSPGMYIGGNDDYARWVVVKEPLDNGMDEALAGRNDLVWLDVAKDGTVTIIDRGHGIPQGVKKYEIKAGDKTVKVKMPTMQAVFGELHTSGKFRSDAYKVSAGTHGVGAKATNATAEFFQVITFYEGQWYEIGFKKGQLTTPVSKSKAPTMPDGKKMQKGTMVRFRHDASIFAKTKTVAFPLRYAREWGEIISYLTPGLRVIITQDGKNADEFYSKNGPSDYVNERVKKLKVDAEPKLLEFHNELADVVVAFTSHTECEIKGYTNGLFNRDGGKHVDAVTGALYKALMKAGNVKLEKAKKKGERAKAPFTEGDMKEGMIGLVNAKLHKAVFNSQDKVKLADDRMGAEFEVELAKAFTKFFEDNKALCKRLIERALALNALRTKFVASKKVVSELNKLKSKGMPAKYSPAAPGTKPEDRELLLVEGDSAGGGIRKARHAYQALLPLKGKILNALKDPSGKAMESEEVLYILGAIGYNPKAPDPMAKLQVGKIICVADPDPDGPFIGDTKIRVRALVAQNPGDPLTLGNEAIESIETLALGEFAFTVPVWVNGAEQWVNATARLERHVDTLVAIEAGKHKYKVSEDHKFMVVRTPAVRERVHSAFSDDLVYVRAADLRCGDRLYVPSNEGGKRDYDKQDKATGRGFIAINKLRIQKQSELVPVYCLTVEQHHHFVLPSGIVSANCHINSLLLALFYKYLPELFERGMVYVAETPEFYAKHKDSLVTGATLSEVQKKLKKIGAPASVDVKHIKGWGEVDAPLLRLLVLNPETRQLIRIKAVESADRTDFVRLMNDDVAYRRDMLGLPMSKAQGAREEAKNAIKKAKDSSADAVKTKSKGDDAKPKKRKKVKAKDK